MWNGSGEAKSHGHAQMRKTRTSEGTDCHQLLWPLRKRIHHQLPQPLHNPLNPVQRRIAQLFPSHQNRRTSPRYQVIPNRYPQLTDLLHDFIPYESLVLILAYCSIMRGEWHGGNVFAAVGRLRYQLGDLIPHAGTETAIQWAVFVGVVTLE
jgi:hypothetical protein